MEIKRISFTYKKYVIRKNGKEKMMKCENIKIRDPFVLVHDGQYYMYGTRSETAFMGEAYGFDVYVSRDLGNWEEPGIFKK